MRQVLIICYTLIVLVSCSLKRQKEEKPIARVLEKYLYEKDIIGLVPEGKGPEDSISIVRSYIDNWIRNELIIDQAEYNIPTEVETEIEKEVDAYREARIIYAYERALVNQKLDTTILPQAIEKYYTENKKNFELKDYIMRGVYVKIERNAPELQNPKTWIISGSEDDFILLEDYCYKYASRFVLDTNKWIYFKDFTTESGYETLDAKDFLLNNTFLELEDQYYLHLLRIDEYKMKDSISPISLQQRNIRSILLNQRKQDLVKSMHNDIYQKALSKGRFEIYE